MRVTLELTPDQVGALAEAVASILGSGGKESLTTQEAAARLGLSRDTVLRRVKAGLIPSISGMGKVRIPAAHIDRLLLKGDAFASCPTNFPEGIVAPKPQTNGTQKQAGKSN